MIVEKVKVALQHIAMKFNYIDPSDGVQCVDYKCIPLVYNASHARRMEEARQYLRGRKKYFIEQQSGWVPTKSAQTDVSKTWAEYREQLQ